MNEQTELRAGLIAAYGKGELLSQQDALIAENERLLMLEKSVLKKTEMLRHGFWDVSEETGPAGKLHAAITALWIDLENESEARIALLESVAPKEGPPSRIT